MKKGIVVALMVVFSMFAVGVAFAVINPDGTMTINEDAKVFPPAKLNADGTKKKNPVTFNHAKHGKDLGCKTCHHQQPELTAENVATIQVKKCFECHGPEPKVVGEKTQLDSWTMIHKGRCVVCHKEKLAADPASKAPTKCNQCHGGAAE